MVGRLHKDTGFGRHDNAELRAIEDECIRDVVRLQEGVGLKTTTDGEYRREVWLASSSARSTVLRHRIDEASKFVPIERLSLSPQCGFSDDMMSDVMSIDEMKGKLAIVVEVADEVWGTA